MRTINNAVGTCLRVEQVKVIMNHMCDNAFGNIRATCCECLALIVVRELLAPPITGVHRAGNNRVAISLAIFRRSLQSLNVHIVRLTMWGKVAIRAQCHGIDDINSVCQVLTRLSRNCNFDFKVLFSCSVDVECSKDNQHTRTPSNWAQHPFPFRLDSLTTHVLHHYASAFSGWIDFIGHSLFTPRPAVIEAHALNLR